MSGRPIKRKPKLPKNIERFEVDIADSEKLLAISAMIENDWTFEQAATRFDVLPSTIRSWINDDKKFGKVYRLKVQQKIDQTASWAVGKMISLANDKDKKISLSATKDLLDRAGFKAIDKSEQKVSTDLVVRVEDDETKRLSE